MRFPGGGVRRRNPRREEYQAQCAVITWLSYELKKYPELAWLYAIPNGGKRSKKTAAMMKAMGVKAGIWDLCLPAARVRDGRILCGLYIELKTLEGQLTPAQRDFGMYLDGAGYATTVCRTAPEARDKILAYLNLPRPAFPSQTSAPTGAPDAQA